jgi:alpha-beta hydrolase superfamily lysophospholipase
MRTHDQRLLNAVQRPEAYEEVVVESDGAPNVLSVWAGPWDAPAVLFLPGTMLHPLFYEDFLDALSRDGLTVVGLHPQAHGKSPRVRRPLSFEALVRGGQVAVEWMRHRFPSAPLVVLGSSQGGAVAMALAVREPDLAAVFAHNVLDPSSPDTLDITRFPRWLTRYPNGVRSFIRAASRVAPGAPLPYWAYLDLNRVTPDQEITERLHSDPLGRRTYPLRLIAGMLDEDVTRPVSCPVTVIAATGDQLFSLDYVRRAFERIDAPQKELLVVDADRHLILVESLDAVLPQLLPRLHAVVPLAKTHLAGVHQADAGAGEALSPFPTAGA